MTNILLRALLVPSLVVSFGLALCATATAQTLNCPTAGALTAVSPLCPYAPINGLEDMTVDQFGNVIGTLSNSGVGPAVVSISPVTGMPTTLISNIPNASQIEFRATDGLFFFTSNVVGGSTTNRVYQMVIIYAGGIPIAATATALTTSTLLLNARGLAIVGTASIGIGNPGDLFVSEERAGGRVMRIETGVLVNGAVRTTEFARARFNSPADLELPLLEFGWVNGLYMSEPVTNTIYRIGPTGIHVPFSTSGSLVLTNPDNLEFGRDAVLYCAEDRTGTSSRVIMLDRSAGQRVFASGFDRVKGLAFDTQAGGLYIGSRGTSCMWRADYPLAGLMNGLEMILGPDTQPCVQRVVPAGSAPLPLLLHSPSGAYGGAPYWLYGEFTTTGVYPFPAIPGWSLSGAQSMFLLTTGVLNAGNTPQVIGNSGGNPGGLAGNSLLLQAHTLPFATTFAHELQL